MKAYIVTQKILALGATYLVRETKDGPVLFTVRGKILTLVPHLEMQKGENGDKTHLLRGNFWKTKFSVSTAAGSPVGEIRFPFIAFFKSFVMTLGETEYKAKGGVLAWHFTAQDPAGKDAFSIQKELAFRDKFTVTLDESLPVEPVILAAIAIDQRFFQQSRTTVSFG